MEITIKTKYELGQKAVAFSHYKSKLRDIEICEVQFDTDGTESSVWYRDKETRELFMEKDVYSSREEFIAQL